MDLLNNIMIYHPIIFKIFLVIFGVLLVFILMSIIHFLGKKKRQIKGEKLLKEVKMREQNLQERKNRLDQREKELERKLNSKYEKKKRNLEIKMNKKFKEELNNIAGLSTEKIVKRYGKLIKNDELDSLWDI